MPLAAALVELSVELDSLSVLLTDFAVSILPLRLATQFSLMDECLLEGILSRVWQAWCVFCRDCVIKSCMGTLTSSGAAVPALPQALSESHVSSAAINAKKKGKPPPWGLTNATLRLEPTWGDIDVLATILSRLQPVNVAQLQAAFSSGTRSAKVLQTIRNGAAHNNHQNMAEIGKLRSGYIVYPINHPTHALFWTDPTSGDFLVLAAIEELRMIGLSAIA